MPFKVAFIVAFVTAVMAASAAARRASSRHGGSLNQLAHEVPGMLLVRAALGLVFYAALATWLFDIPTGAWSYLPLPVTARWVGVACLLPTLSFFVWSLNSLGASYRGGVGLYPAHELVTTGSYRLIRHEERQLADRFGSAWDAYRSQTGRVLPNFHRRQEASL